MTQTQTPIQEEDTFAYAVKERFEVRIYNLLRDLFGQEPYESGNDQMYEWQTDDGMMGGTFTIQEAAVIEGDTDNQGAAFFLQVDHVLGFPVGVVDPSNYSDDFWTTDMDELERRWEDAFAPLTRAGLLTAVEGDRLTVICDNCGERMQLVDYDTDDISTWAHSTTTNTLCPVRVRVVNKG